MLSFASFVALQMMAQRRLLRTKSADLVLDYKGAGGTTFPLPSMPGDITR
ncbi:hypothetical protein [Limosilactobacillus albertensis]|nr:hypothetical protein [Limosilactobacillus albertensis]MCD7123184.1 hypothetical protein [Limosilactobacillus albertensis]